MIFVYVEDVDHTVATATTDGAELLMPPQDQFWGDRVAWLMDPSGHVWTVATRIAEPDEAERSARWSSILEQDHTPRSGE